MKTKEKENKIFGGLSRGPSGPSGRSPTLALPGSGRFGHGLFLFLAIFSIFILLFSSGCVRRNPTGPADIEPLFHNYWSPWWPAMIVLPAAIMVAVIALSWFYGSFAMDDKVKAWCKSEAGQLFYTVLIALAAMVVVAVLSNAVLSISQVTANTGPEGEAWATYVNLRCTSTGLPAYDRPCHIRLAEDYLQILASAAQEQAAAVLRYNSVLAEASSISLTFRGMPDPSGDLAFAPMAGLTIPLETLSFVFDLANKNIMAIRFQQFLLDLLHLAFFPLFLSLGLFLRTFFFTRRLGGLLIAMALSMYLVYPLMYVFFHSVLFSFTGPWPAPQAGEKDAYLERVGVGLYPITLDLGGITQSLVQPIKTAPTYNAQCADTSRIYPGEECNKPADANRSDTGRPNTIVPFNCPPRDASGQLLPGRGHDTICDYNACRCVNATVADARGPTATTRDAYGRYISKFREEYVGTGTRDTALKAGTELATNMCFNSTPMSDSEASAADEKSRALMLGASKDAMTKVSEGWGKAMQIALSQDELLGYHGVIDNLGKILIFSLLTPFLAIMVALASIKVFSPLLGGDVEIAGLTRLI